MNKRVLKLIDLYIKKNKYSLVDFQHYILDKFEVESSISFGENDIEEYIEIYGDTTIKVNTKGELI